MRYTIYIIQSSTYVVFTKSAYNISGWAEQLTAVICQERAVVHIHSDGVRGLVLKCEAYIVLYAIPLLKCRKKQTQGR